MEQQTPIPPKSRMKAREGQKRAIFPSLIWGEGGSRFSIYFVQDCSWPAILDLKSVGTGPSSRPILLRFHGNFFCFSSGLFEILESDLFQDNFSMALYSFGGVNDQCSVTSWAVQETGMLPLLSCGSDMTAWLKHK